MDAEGGKEAVEAGDSVVVTETTSSQSVKKASAARCRWESPLR